MKNILPPLFLVLSLCVAHAQPASKSDIAQRIHTYLSELNTIGFNGAVLVELNGEKIISSGYGYRNVHQNLNNTPETVFDIGSITKQFTATAILKLEMEGKLNVNDRIPTYFTNVPKDKENITLHDLLRHQSGLVSNVGKDYERITNDEFITKVMNSPLRFEIGTDFSYSNVGYSLLAMVVEQVSGQTYETYLYNNLWKPAQMEQTGYTRPKYDSSLIAVGYDMADSIWGKPTEKEWDSIAPYWHLLGNGGILSSIEDMYKWHKALAGKQILSDKAKQKLYHPQLRTGENEKSFYGYGWDVSITARNTKQVWHNGTNRIFYADFLRYPDEHIAIIMLTNKAHPNFRELSSDISKIIFNPAYQPLIPVADNKSNRNFTNNILKTIETAGFDKAKETYVQRNENENLLEFVLNSAAFDNLDSGKPQIAIDIFKLNVLAFPKSARALQFMGEGYMETGNNELALKFFLESLAIDPDNPFIISMIKKLEK